MKMSLEEFEEAVKEELDLLPEEFFDELNGGVMVSEEEKLSPDDMANDLYVLGLYKRNILGNMIILYYGSFVQMLPFASEKTWHDKIREVVRHEFRHHVENRAGIHNKDSLEAEDARELMKYREAHQERRHS